MRPPGFFVAIMMILSGCDEVRPGLCPAPLAGWYEPKTGGTGGQVRARIALAGTRISWNGDPTDEKELAEYLRLSRTMSPPPLVMFDPAGAESCAQASRIRDLIDKEYDCRANKCWQGSQQEFQRAPVREGELHLPW